MQWINRLDIGNGHYSFVFDHSLTAIASSRKSLLGMDLAGVKDFKGHDLAASAYQESRTSGHGFAIFHWPAANKENTAGKEKSELRYAYFASFQRSEEHTSELPSQISTPYA